MGEWNVKCQLCAHSRHEKSEILILQTFNKCFSYKQEADFVANAMDLTVHLLWCFVTKAFSNVPDIIKNKRHQKCVLKKFVAYAALLRNIRSSDIFTEPQLDYYTQTVFMHASWRKNCTFFRNEMAVTIDFKDFKSAMVQHDLTSGLFSQKYMWTFLGVQSICSYEYTETNVRE